MESTKMEEQDPSVSAYDEIDKDLSKRYNAMLEGHAQYDVTATTGGKAAPSTYSSGAGATTGGEAFTTTIRRKQLEEENASSLVIWPWNKKYKAWWGLTVFCALFTIFTETYAIAFSPAGLYPYNDASSIIEYILVVIFAIDIVVTFNLAYYDDEEEQVIYEKGKIARRYFDSRMFWYDFAGVFPFYLVALAMSGELGQDSTKASYLSILRLVKLVRLHRTKQLFDTLQYNTHISLFSLTLTRNFCFCLVWSHFSACVFYFISRQYDFNPDETWIGGAVIGLNGFERYVTSLYWSVVTFTTVGYGDFSPVNSIEQIWGMLYMLLNIIAQSWMIGSITLLIVKQDEKTGNYRDAMQTLQQYSELNHFPKKFEKSLKRQLQLEFNTREISDENVLAQFPAEVRRKVLRRMYLPFVLQTSLMKGIRQHFVDAFLSACRVEIFGPGEEIIQRGNQSSDLYLLVSGYVKLFSFGTSGDRTVEEVANSVAKGGGGATSLADSELRNELASYSNESEMGPGEFLNEISFFTESPQTETIRTKNICKALTMSRSSYKSIAEDHPGSVGTVLQNLLEKVELAVEMTGVVKRVCLPTKMSVLRAGSVYDVNTIDDVTGDGTKATATATAPTSPTSTSSFSKDVRQTMQRIQVETSHTAVQDLVKMHMNKQKDDHTTRFLFAASRDDVATISLMCDQGFDPNNADYDRRTALMVSSMKGNTETVTKLLEDYHANPNLVDMHGTSALVEATRNGHEETMDVLLKFGAQLCFDEGQAASRLCQTVFDGDMLTLRRLLRAKIQVNAGDYDKRTAAHIAAAEGNLPAIKVLVEFGADLTLEDRWGNTIHDEAKRANAGKLAEYLQSLGNERTEKRTNINGDGDDITDDNDQNDDVGSFMEKQTVSATDSTVENQTSET